MWKNKQAKKIRKNRVDTEILYNLIKNGFISRIENEEIVAKSRRAAKILLAESMRYCGDVVMDVAMIIFRATFLLSQRYGNIAT